MTIARQFMFINELIMLLYDINTPKENRFTNKVDKCLCGMVFVTIFVIENCTYRFSRKMQIWYLPI